MFPANSHKPKHRYSWKTLVRSRKEWPSLRTALCDNVNVATTLYRGESWTNARADARANLLAGCSSGPEAEFVTSSIRFRL